MADIEIMCHNCGNVITVSEFVDPGSITCRACGEKLSTPGETVTAPESGASPGLTEAAVGIDIAQPAGASSLKLRGGGEEAPAPAAPMSKQDKKREKKQKQTQRKQDEKVEVIKVERSPHFIYAWIVFVVLAGVGGLLRYGDLLPSIKAAMGGKIAAFGELTDDYGIWLALLLHVVVVLKAFKDSMFQGILCCLVPGYSLYYVIIVSDDFYLRAITAGCLVAVGQDASMDFFTWSQGVYEKVNAWMISGGGDIR